MTSSHCRLPFTLPAAGVFLPSPLVTMSGDSSQYLTLPDAAVNDQSPLSVGSVASDSSFEEQFSTPRPYLDSSPLPAPPQPNVLRRSTSAPYQPSLPSFLESIPPPQPRHIIGTPPTLPLLTEQSSHRPYLSLTINQSDEPTSSPKPGSSHRKSCSYSQASPTSAGQSATSSIPDTPSPLVELSPMHKRLKARGARAMSVGSAQPYLSRTFSPPRSTYSPPVGAKDDSGKVKEVADMSGSPFDYWAMEDESASELDEAATPPSLSSTRHPSLRSIYRTSTSDTPSHCPSIYPTKPRLYRCCGGCLRFAFFTLFAFAFVFFLVVLVVQFRGATLYSNAVCRPLDTTISTSTASTLPYPLRSVIKTQTTLPKSKVYLVFWNTLNAFFGIFSLLRYSATSILTAMTRRIRVPAGFNSSAALYSPNYTGSPLLELPLNHFRMIGSHNSYHMKSSYPIPAHQYAHAPLPAQLGDYSDGVRQVEIDIHILEGKGGNVMYHVQLLDDHTNCYCLTECLLLVREWSKLYTLHYPIMLMVEFKRQAYEDLLVGLNGITCNDLYNLEIALLDVFPPGSFLLPRHVRGSFPTLLSALTYRSYLDRKTNRWNTTTPSDRPTPAEDAEMAPLAQYAATNVSFGWPSMGEMLGRVMFVWLDDVFNYADRLPCVRDDPSSENIALFIAQSKWNRTYSAVQVNRDPLIDWNLNQIQRAIDHGLLVRTLTTTAQVSRRDTRRYEAALQYGMHYLSSDFEAPCAGNIRSASNMTVSTARGGQPGRNVSIASWVDLNEYEVFCERLPSGWPFECHPQLSPPWCEEELNRIRVEGLAAMGRYNATEAEKVRVERARVATMGQVFAGMEFVLG